MTFLYYGTTILSLGWMQSVVTGSGFLGTEIDDKLAGTLEFGKNTLVTG